MSYGVGRLAAEIIGHKGKPLRSKKIKEEPVKIITCIKQVPDSEAKVTAQDGQVSWGESPLVINPFDEYAVEAALQQKD